MNTQQTIISSTAESASHDSLRRRATVTGQRDTSSQSHLMKCGIHIARTSDLCGVHGSDIPLMERLDNDTKNVDRCASTRRNAGGTA